MRERIDAPVDQQPSPYELGRRMDDVANRLEGIMARFETQFLRAEVFEAYKEYLRSEHRELDERIKKVESRQDWVVRTVGTVLIGAILGAVFALGKVH